MSHSLRSLANNTTAHEYFAMPCGEGYYFNGFHYIYNSYYYVYAVCEVMGITIGTPPSFKIPRSSPACYEMLSFETSLLPSGKFITETNDPKYNNAT